MISLANKAKNEIAVCNLASIVLPKFVETVKDESSQENFYHDCLNRNYKFNHEKLKEVVKVITRNLNKIIDENFYPVAGLSFTDLQNIYTRNRSKKAEGRIREIDPLALEFRAWLMCFS